MRRTNKQRKQDNNLLEAKKPPAPIEVGAVWSEKPNGEQPGKLRGGNFLVPAGQQVSKSAGQQVSNLASQRVSRSAGEHVSRLEQGGGSEQGRSTGRR